MKISLALLLFTSINISAQQAEDPVLFDGVCNYFDQFDKVEAPINDDWVNTDIAVIEDINKIAYADSTDEILQIYPHFFDGKCNCNSVTYDISPNLKSTIYEIYGGYGSAKISIIYSDKTIVKLRIIFDNHAEILQQYLINKLRFPLTCISGKPGFELINQKNHKYYENRNDRLFLYSDDTIIKRRDALNYFTDDLANGTFSEPYFVLFGLGSETFNHIRYFIVNRDYDAMKSLIYSTSPTTRILFANTLLYMQKHYNYRLDKGTRNKVTSIIKEGQPIKSGIISCWIDKFDYDRYDISKNFEKYLISE